MKIYSMTATFGKLEHETLTLKPGLNIIEAPNEWGKSTWCAFLVNMLYGIDTRARSTGTTLAAKERYAPWSGAPMAGRIDLSWNGKDITIERSTKGRLIFGDFRAYETATGIDIPELSSANCGQMLLGVERSVFTRAGFLKLSDLPVTQDDALRRRLNNLVTTGDESGAGDRLGKQLKDLKNRCRYNRTGLLPQAEAEQAQLMAQLNELQELTEQSQSIHSRQEALEKSIAMLENHRAALRYEAAKADAEKVAAAEAALEQAKAALSGQSEKCSQLPDRQTTQKKLRAAQALQEEWMALQMQTLPTQPVQPELPVAYRGKNPEEICAAAQSDFEKQQSVEKRRKKQSNLITGIFIAFLVVLVGLAAAAILISGFDKLWLAVCGAAAVVIAAASLVWSAVRAKGFRADLDKLYDRHPGLSPDKWVSDANEQAARLEQYRSALASYEQAAAELNVQRSDLDAKITALTGGKPLSDCQTRCNQIIDQWNALEDARRDLVRTEGHVQDLQAMAKTAEKPTQPDMLTQTESETDALLSSARFELKQLHLKLGQNQGRAEALGQETAIRNQLKAVNRRISQLEDTYTALELAQKALSAATTELQRRFAPRIAKRAQELFSKLTSGRYQRITLGEDLSLSTGAVDEDTLHASQWRSDGTVDQLYLALRLAVAEELTPEAPLVLDDALVRFDDKRLAVALDILKEASENKQVIVFTCQGRETALTAQ